MLGSVVQVHLSPPRIRFKKSGNIQKPASLPVRTRVFVWWGARSLTTSPAVVVYSIRLIKSCFKLTKTLADRNMDLDEEREILGLLLATSGGNPAPMKGSPAIGRKSRRQSNTTKLALVLRSLATSSGLSSCRRQLIQLAPLRRDCVTPTCIPDSARAIRITAASETPCKRDSFLAHSIKPQTSSALVLTSSPSPADDE